jgi:hypothetical protein
MTFASATVIHRVYEAVKKGPATAAELAASLGLYVTLARAAVRELERQGRVHHSLAPPRGGQGRRRFVYSTILVKTSDADEYDGDIARDNRTETACRAHLADLARAYEAPLPSIALRESMVPVRMSAPL